MVEGRMGFVAQHTNKAAANLTWYNSVAIDHSNNSQNLYYLKRDWDGSKIHALCCVEGSD